MMKEKSILIKTIIHICTAILLSVTLITFISFAWYTNNKKASSSGIVGSISTSSNIKDYSLTTYKYSDNKISILDEQNAESLLFGDIVYFVLDLNLYASQDITVKLNNIDGSISRALNKPTPTKPEIIYEKNPYFELQQYDDTTNIYSYTPIYDDTDSIVQQNMCHCFDVRLVNDTIYDIDLENNYADANANYFKPLNLPTNNILNFFDENNKEVSSLTLYNNYSNSTSVQLCFAVQFRSYLSSEIPLNLVSNQSIHFGSLIIH